MDELSEQGAEHVITRRAVADALAEQQTGRTRRLSLDEIHGDLMTVDELCRWAGCSKGTGYELCRSGLLREHVIRIGRQIRLPKKVVARLMNSE